MKRNQKRQRIKRIRKPAMLVMGEGNYATERMYLKHFTGKAYSYCLKFGNSGGYTDPAQIFRELKIFLDFHLMMNLLKDLLFVILVLLLNLYSIE